MKIETAEMKFIRDNQGVRWFLGSQDFDVVWKSSNNNAEALYAMLTERGLLTPDPLEEALVDIEKLIFRVGLWEHGGIVRAVEARVRKLAADLTA